VDDVRRKKYDMVRFQQSILHIQMFSTETHLYKMFIRTGCTLSVGACGGVERQIGVVTRYFPRINVGVLRLDDDLVVGEEILIRGPATNFVQKVDSMQIEHKQIPRAVKGQEIGLKTQQKVHEGDKVYRKT
jgi:hypothetical protein